MWYAQSKISRQLNNTLLTDHNKDYDSRFIFSLFKLINMCIIKPSMMFFPTYVLYKDSIEPINISSYQLNIFVMRMLNVHFSNFKIYITLLSTMVTM